MLIIRKAPDTSMRRRMHHLISHNQDAYSVLLCLPRWVMATTTAYSAPTCQPFWRLPRQAHKPMRRLCTSALQVENFNGIDVRQ